MRFLFLWGISLAVFWCACAAAETPNVVFILADDLGWSDTTLYGQTDLYETPNLERLAARGMTFTRAYTPNPLCSPTRASILTGLHPARTGLTAPNCHKPEIQLQATTAKQAASDRKRLEVQSVTRLDPKYQTLAETLHHADYVTGHFGKWHLGKEPYSPLEHGFDVDVPHWHGPGPAGSFVAPWKFPDFKEKTPGEHIEDRMGDEAVAFLEANQDKPFFLNYWQFSVHAPFDAKQKYIEEYRSKVNPDDAQRSPTYAAMVRSLDDNVGKILDALDRLNLADRTIIYFFSDNGGNMYNEVDGTTPTSNRPLRGGKATMYDGGTRVPAVAVWPGVTEPGTQSDELISGTDFYPTILEQLELTKPEDVEFDGVSLVSALRGGSLERDAVFTFFPHAPGVPDRLPPSVAIHQGDWKLIRVFHNSADGSHEYQLYHLSEDIGEANNLAAEYPERVAAMDAEITAFLEGCEATVPLLNPNYDPSSAALDAMGVKSGKDCELRVAEGKLQVKSTGKDPSFRIFMESPVEKGAVELHLRLKTSIPGVVEVRWEEKGTKPAYQQSRLVRADKVQGEDWVNLQLSFTAKNPLVSIRLDPGQGTGEMEIDQVSLIREGETLQTWEFDSP